MTEPLLDAAQVRVATGYHHHDYVQTGALVLTNDRPIATALTPNGLCALTSPSLAAVLRERIDQIDRHGFDQAHDAAHDEAEIGRGALAYLVAGLIEEGMDPVHADLTALDLWPWQADAFRPTDYHGCLVKAAAMCIAEADRVMAARALIDAVRS